MTPDTTFAWSCTANLSLYDEDPGPRTTEVAGGGESRMVDRRVALIDLYARQLLVKLDADVARLAAVAAESAAKRSTPAPCSGAARPLRTATAPCPRCTLRSGDCSGRGRCGRPTPRDRREMAQVWEIAAELADTARQRIIDAGAEHDPKARDRLLAPTSHTLTAEILGVFLPPEVHLQRATSSPRPSTRSTNAPILSGGSLHLLTRRREFCLISTLMVALCARNRP